MACVLKERSDELKRAPERVDKFIRYGEPIYYMHKIPVHAGYRGSYLQAS